jgi:hypothetical protein
LYIQNLRPELGNQGPLDAVNSPSFKSLLKAKSDGSLTRLQQDLFVVPRPAEEFFDVIADPLQQFNLFADPVQSKNVNKLRKILTQWKVDTGDTEPVNLTKDWYGRVNGETLPEKDKRGEMPGASKHADKNNSRGPF